MKRPDFCVLGLLVPPQVDLKREISCKRERNFEKVLVDLSLEGAAAKVAGKWFVAGVLPVGSSEEGEEGGGKMR